MAQAIVQRACGDLRSAIGDEALVRLNFTADLQDMLEALEDIQPVLEAADIMLFRVPFVFEWQQSVWDAAYKVMDMADELQDTTSLATAQMARMLPCHSIMKYAMATKVDETKKQVMGIRRLCPRFISQEVGDVSVRIIEERKTGPVFEEAMVFHRGSDKERIMDVLLLSANRNNTQELITIIPIFGLAGSGKTTLAQMVFSDTHSLQGYDFRVWVHVSPELEFQTVGESIIHWVSGTGGGQEEVNDDHASISDVEGMEHIMKRLHQLLNGKKVLLVLDDLWEEDPIQLQLLKSMLTFLGGKVDVIVTTCNQAIARNICTVEPYRLNSLSDDTCWEIIKKSIHFEDKKELEKIGREMASKCCGVPSAAQAFEIMLYSGDAKGWKEVLNIDIWGHLCGFDTKSSLLLSTLELSYMSMPPDLRLCFAFCVIFPNGHKFVMDDLIHQWITLHLIEPSEILSATHTAEEYLTRLLDMSFLQTANSDPASGKDDKGAILFTMHDLVHDFARRFPQCLWYGLATNHHGKLDDTYAGVTRALRCVGCSKVEFNDDSFSRMKCLRVLELKGSSVEKLPDSICQLRHLGYLKISDFSGLVTLPKSLGRLINLLHIDLSDCSGLLYLPESFGKLTRLVHANLSGCSRLANLPESFGDLINLSHVNLSRCHGLAELPEPLRKLDKLVHLDLSFCSCFEGIGKVLGGLTNLEHLNLSNTSCYLAQHRFRPQDLKVAVGKLTKLRYLNLSMCLNTIFYYYRTQEGSLQYILDCLRDLSSLEHLDLSHNTFLFDLPGSLGDLSMLHTLNLSGCIRLKRVGEIKSLKFIYLRNCRALESCSFVVSVDDDDTYRSSNIDQLEHVNCQELQISCLEKVRYREEAQGIKLVEKKKLAKLKLSWTSKLVPPPNLQCQQLQISCLENVRSSEEAQRIKLAEKLKLEKLKPSWTVEYPPRSVEDSVLLGGLVPPPNLQCLELNGYLGMCLPEYLSDLTSLRELKIVCCEQLNYLPDSIQKLTNLKDLCISHCPELEKWCQLEENKKMLVHIPNKKYGVMSKQPNLSKEASLEIVRSKQSTCNGEQPGVARWTQEKNTSMLQACSHVD